MHLKGSVGSVGSSGVCSVLLIFFTVLDLVEEVKHRVTQTCGCEQPQVVEKKVDSNVIITGNVGETGLYLQNCRKNWQLPPSHVSTFQNLLLSASAGIRLGRWRSKQ